MLQLKKFEKIKSDFPIFNRKVHSDKPLVYLDSAATSQKPLQVIKAMDDFYRNSNSNIHRGIHELAEEATGLYEAARTRIARFLHIDNARQIIFTRNTTESINLVAQTWGRKVLQKGDLIVLTRMEHHSNLVPWYMLKEEKDLRIAFIELTESGELDLEQYSALLEQNPKLVAFTHMSNVLGTINPAQLITHMAHDAGTLVLIDGAQSAPHFPVNLTELDADFFAFSAHKMVGPTGIGVLYGKLALLEKMPPFLGGGDMIRKVTFEGFKVNSIPYKFEAGTPAIAEGIGFGAAIDYLESVGMETIARHEQELTRYAMHAMGSVAGVTIVGPEAEKRGGVVSFSFEGVHPHDVAQILDSEGIAVRAGHHCAMPLHQWLNLPATTRASLYLYNKTEDIDALVKGLAVVRKIFT
ncbi:MAG: cysteine desulfurase [Anaerolineaceae bacterium]|nr:cysteine desulfurase [Anaerolineaceae bacterium]